MVGIIDAGVTPHPHPHRQPPPPTLNELNAQAMHTISNEPLIWPSSVDPVYILNLHLVITMPADGLVYDDGASPSAVTVLTIKMVMFI